MRTRLMADQKRQSPISGALTLPMWDGNIAGAAIDTDVDSTQLLRHVNTRIVFAVSAASGSRTKRASRTQTVIPGSGDPLHPGRMWDYASRWLEGALVPRLEIPRGKGV